MSDQDVDVLLDQEVSELENREWAVRKLRINKKGFYMLLSCDFDNVDFVPIFTERSYNWTPPAPFQARCVLNNLLFWAASEVAGNQVNDDTSA